MRDAYDPSAREWAKGARCLLAAALAVAALGLLAVPAVAAPHRFSPRVVPDPLPPPVINTTVDQSLGDCSVSCSLRDAVALSALGATLAVPAGHYVLTLGPISITQDLTLAGSGARTTVIDGNASSDLFEIFGAINFAISDLSLVNGNGPFGGGAITAVAFNPAELALTIRRCTFANNQSPFGGGALNLQLVALTIEDSTFSNNHTDTSFGGAISSIQAQGSIVNSTFSGNTAASGGAFEFGGPGGAMSLINNTITANQTSFSGAIEAITVQLSLSNNIIAENLGGDCSIILSSSGTDHNIYSDNSCGLTGPGDLPGVNPLLGPLANNGGMTDTTALLGGSPAINAGNNATCPATDQRGISRPQGPACDIGAYELVEAPDCSHATASPNLLWPPNHKFVPIQVTGVTNPGGGPVTITVTSIFQDEPVTHGPDGTGVGTSTASVRAERDGGGDGRVYHIAFTATNAGGGSCMGAVTVGVPHDQGPHGGPVDEGPLYDSTQP